MNGSMNLSGNPFLAAQAVSYAKGGEETQKNSKDKLDQKRLFGQLIAQEKQTEKIQKTAQKGVLA